MARPALRGPGGKPANRSVTRGTRWQKPDSPTMELDDGGQIPAGDQHNIRGFATHCTALGGAIRGTRPDLDAEGMRHAA